VWSSAEVRWRRLQAGERENEAAALAARQAYMPPSEVGTRGRAARAALQLRAHQQQSAAEVSNPKPSTLNSKP